MLASYYNICDNYGTLGQDLAKLPTNIFLLMLLEKSISFLYQHHYHKNVFMKCL